ncbi:hypothetical protein LEMA_P122890.1 [Plenodomus lingam JN3]|uniref:Protein kinase domain-containing protein n=2 Tax=Leptosphaeria maculans TaxID=5022 RepID=E4ZSD0_LEPMJ|nr:hypothetical protein LEMA_P122890.1 [Plenodomus lingam JN3]CBX94310.1 hypothetical protein LEMA_P122890.1 [Plenodomus lingam JN3]
MGLEIGQNIEGDKGMYQIVQPLKGSTVFKAEIIEGDFASDRWSVPAAAHHFKPVADFNPRAVVKTALTYSEKKNLQQEYDFHKNLSRELSPHIRSLRDTVKGQDPEAAPLCLVFEWMERAMGRLIRGGPEFLKNPSLLRAISKSTLLVLEAMESSNPEHIGLFLVPFKYKSLRKLEIRPTKILLSNIDTDKPIAKLTNLLRPSNSEGVDSGCQRPTYRAPEVWRGLPCTHVSHVWSLGVMLANSLCTYHLFCDRNHLGKHNAGRNEWCIARLFRLVGPIMDPVSHSYAKEFKYGRKLSVYCDEHGRLYLPLSNWRQELEKVNDAQSDDCYISKTVLDFIQSLLVVTPEMRSTAKEALALDYFLKKD